MTPKEKAEYLWDKFDETIALNSWADEKTSIDELVLLPKKCALVAVDEILLIFYEDMNELRIKEIDYWSEVKYEIEKL